MIFGWLLSSVLIWQFVPSLRWIEALVIAACVTATDPVLASAVVGKGKFARRVPGHLRNLLSAESGCNDGMAFPFVYLALSCIQHAGHPGKIAFHFIVITLLYECLFGTILGAIIGYAGRHAIKFAESRGLIDRESFLVFYFVLALFCTGVGSIIGTDDLLVAFAAGAAFSWDGWFARKTEETHVSNVIDLLLNMAFFVYFGAIIPWEMFSEPALGIYPWKLVVIAILLILFRRIPILLALKPIIPDIRTWREALFCGHFGPIGVGAIFMAILARAELEHDSPTPLAELPTIDHPNYTVVAVIWPIVTFMIIASIIVHGSSIAVFTLGKRLNNLTMTLSLTQTNGEKNPSWLSRLQRFDSRNASFSSKVEPPLLNQHPTSPGKGKGSGGIKRIKRISRKRAPHVPESIAIDLNSERKAERERQEALLHEHRHDTSLHGYCDDSNGIQAYQEGNEMILEDSDGEFIEAVDTSAPEIDDHKLHKLPVEMDSEPLSFEKRKKHRSDRPVVIDSQGGPKLVVYQLDDNIIVENHQGEILKRYRYSSGESSGKESFLHRTLSFVGLKRLADSYAGSADIENQQNVRAQRELINVPTAFKHEDADKIDDERMKRHLKRYMPDHKITSEKTTATLLSTQDQDPLTTQSPIVSRRPSIAATFDLSGASDTSVSSSSEDDEHETAIEKERRLAALRSVKDTD